MPVGLYNATGEIYLKNFIQRSTEDYAKCEHPIQTFQLRHIGHFSHGTRGYFKQILKNFSREVRKMYFLYLAFMNILGS